MKLQRLANSPSALINFYEEGLGALGAVCDRTWHDRLQLVAEGAAARLWDPEGKLLDTEIHFVAPDDNAPRRADAEVFPGCPLTFRLAEALRPVPLPLERGKLLAPDIKAPAADVAEKLWHAQFPGCSRWRLESLSADWHFSLLALVRCEVQAIDQHWSVHRIAISLPDGQPDASLAADLGFLELSPAASEVPWPGVDLAAWREFLKRAIEQDIEPDLVQVRERQQKYLRRELERVDSYFASYEKEISDRQKRSHSEGAKLKAEERLAAAKNEHARRREDQIQRHNIRVITHLDFLMLIAEPAWAATVSFTQRGEPKTAHGSFIPRARRWLVEEGGP